MGMTLKRPTIYTRAGALISAALLRTDPDGEITIDIPPSLPPYRGVGVEEVWHGAPVEVALGKDGRAHGWMVALLECAVDDEDAVEQERQQYQQPSQVGAQLISTVHLRDKPQHHQHQHVRAPHQLGARTAARAAAGGGGGGGGVVTVVVMIMRMTVVMAGYEDDDARVVPSSSSPTITTNAPLPALTPAPPKTLFHGHDAAVSPLAPSGTAAALRTAPCPSATPSHAALHYKDMGPRPVSARLQQSVPQPCLVLCSRYHPPGHEKALQVLCLG